jgi:hypothetical protein
VDLEEGKISLDGYWVNHCIFGILRECFKVHRVIDLDLGFGVAQELKHIHWLLNL